MDHDPPPTPPSATAPWPTAAQIVGAGQSAKDACTKSIVSATVRAGYDGGRVGTHRRARGICRRGSPQQGPQPGAPLAVPGSPEPPVASTRPHPSVVPGWGLVRAVSGEGGGRYHSETQLESPLGCHGNYDTHQYSHTASRTTREPHTTSQAKLPHDHQRAPPPVPYLVRAITGTQCPRGRMVVHQWHRHLVEEDVAAYAAPRTRGMGMHADVA